MIKSIQGIIFSKDRALQLDGLLRSFALHCQDIELVDLNIIYTTSNQTHNQQYQQLEQEYPKYIFVKEDDFHINLLELCNGKEYLLFLVDDNIFVRPFNLQEIITALKNQPEALSFSLRLGENNNYFYMKDWSQKVPELHKTDNPLIFSFDWTKAECDFAMPIEVSSSIFRAFDLWPFLSRIEFSNPNSLEHNLALFRHRFRDIAPNVLCYQKSRTFCNPINIVNNTCQFRSGNRKDYSSSALSQLFEQGLRIDVHQYEDYQTNACHQEVELRLCKKEVTKINKAGVADFTEALKDDSADKLETARNLKKLFSDMGLHDNAANTYKAYLNNHPEDRELVSALNFWEEHNSKAQALPPSVSIIIPAYNCSSTINKSLDSIITALRYCSEIIPGTNYEQWAEIIVVNDNSTDQTAATVKTYCVAEPHKIKLFNNRENLGAGPSRNLGVHHASGDLIFFLDGDDLFLKEHIFLCLHTFTTKPWLHFVHTGIRIDEKKILPYWKRAIENSVPFNLCVRRWCHDCIGGYPEAKAFQSMRCEDAFYRTLLNRFFLGHKIKRETIHHFRYPGNALDRQMEKFSNPPTKTCSEEVMTKEELAVFPEIKQLMATKTIELENNFKAWQQNLRQCLK